MKQKDVSELLYNKINSDIGSKIQIEIIRKKSWMKIKSMAGLVYYLLIGI